MKTLWISLATVIACIAQAQTTWTLQGRTLNSYANNEVQFQGTNSNASGGASIPYTYSDHKNLPQQILSSTPPMSANQPPWSSSFDPVSNTFLAVPYAIQNYLVAPQMQVVIYVTWTEQKGGEGWSNGSTLKSRNRDWCEPASSRIADMGINDPLGEFHNRPV